MENNQTYPILSAMAKDYLTVQASSVSVERTFSSSTEDRMFLLFS
jgi:hypothetical protein